MPAYRGTWLARVASGPGSGHTATAEPSPELSSPEVCVSRSWIVIARCAGTMRCSGTSPFAPLPLATNQGLMSRSAGSLSTATCMSPNSGR